MTNNSLSRVASAKGPETDLEANPDGSKMYGVWAQWVFGDLGIGEEVGHLSPYQLVAQ